MTTINVTAKPQKVQDTLNSVHSVPAQDATNRLVHADDNTSYHEQIFPYSIPTSLPAPSVPTKSSYSPAIGEAWRVDFALEMMKLGYDDQAETFLQCGKRPVAVITCAASVNHPSTLIRNHCDNPLCPSCASRESRRLVEFYTPRIEKIIQDNRRPGYRLRHMILTTDTPPTQADAGERIDKLFPRIPEAILDCLLTRNPTEKAGAWRERRRAMKRKIGIQAAWEFGESGYKLHFHVTYYGPFIPQPILSKSWAAHTGYPVVWITSRDDSPVAEVLKETLKYTTKFIKNGQVIPPGIAARVFQIKCGEKCRRRVRSWGLFYNMPEPPTDDEPACKCEQCNSPMKLLQSGKYLERVAFYTLEIQTEDMPDLTEQTIAIVAAFMLQGRDDTRSRAAEVWQDIWSGTSPPDPATFADLNLDLKQGNKSAHGTTTQSGVSNGIEVNET